MKKLQYIFIDFDGTLLEGKYKHYNCYKDIINKSGGIPLDINIYWNMKRSKVSTEVLLSKSNYKSTYGNFINEWIENIEKKEYLKYDILKPEVKETLKKWKKYSNTLILVTMRRNNKNLYWQLEKFKIKNLFNKIIICKYNKNLNNYNFIKKCEFNKSLVIGDTECDIKLAKEYKMKCVAITNGLRNKELLQADFYAEEINQIRIDNIIEKII